MRNNYSINIPVDENMRKLRLSEHKINISGNFMVEDDLEINGTLKVYEYLGGVIPMHLKPSEMSNAVLVASVTITARHDLKECRLVKIFHEYGYDFLANPMLEQVLYFADFYGYSLVLLNLRKRQIRRPA